MESKLRKKKTKHFGKKKAKKKVVKKSEKPLKKVVVKKPELKSQPFLDLIHLEKWCKGKYNLDIQDFRADLEAGNDSYVIAWTSDMETSEYDYQKELAKILKEDFGVEDKIAFWVCW